MLEQTIKPEKAEKKDFLTQIKDIVNRIKVLEKNEYNKDLFEKDWNKYVVYMNKRDELAAELKKNYELLIKSELNPNLKNYYSMQYHQITLKYILPEE